MFRKIILSGCVLALLAALGALTAGTAFAASSDTAEIKVRCTVTLSVSLVAGNTFYDFGSVLAASTTYSNAPIIFKNDSTGAICLWDLNIDSETLKDANNTYWTLDSQPGLNQIAMFAVFKKGTPQDSDFDVNADTLSATAKEYNDTNFSDPDYGTDGLGGVPSKILPENFATLIGKSAERKLWLKIRTPMAVTDTNQRTIHLKVTAKMAG